MYIDNYGNEFHSREEAEEWETEQELRQLEEERRTEHERREQRFRSHELLLDKDAWSTGYPTPQPSGPSFRPGAFVIGAVVLLVLFTILHFM